MILFETFNTMTTRKSVAAKAAPAVKKTATKTKSSLLKDLRKKLVTELAHVDALIKSTEAK